MHIPSRIRSVIKVACEEACSSARACCRSVLETVMKKTIVSKRAPTPQNKANTSDSSQCTDYDLTGKEVLLVKLDLYIRKFSMIFRLDNLLTNYP